MTIKDLEQKIEVYQKTVTFHAQAANYHALMYEEGKTVIENLNNELCDLKEKDDLAKAAEKVINEEKEDIPSQEEEFASEENKMRHKHHNEYLKKVK